MATPDPIRPMRGIRLKSVIRKTVTLAARTSSAIPARPVEIKAGSRGKESKRIEAANANNTIKP
jgi:hypothetical protein